MSCKIVGFENGPLELECENIEVIQEEQRLEHKNPAYLCRCGASKNKPFCDGSHTKAGFVSKNDISKEVLQSYEGKELTVNFNRSICSGASKCVQGLASVFKSGDGSHWIYPDEDSTEKIINQIKACPSGALSYTQKGEIHIDSRKLAMINIIKNGPYNVEGVSLEGFHIPTHFSPSKYALCRCGHSKNKPFCDYSHAQKAWKD